LALEQTDAFAGKEPTRGRPFAQAKVWSCLRTGALLLRIVADYAEAAQTVLAMRVLRRQQDGSWKFARAAITQGPPKS